LIGKLLGNFEVLAKLGEGGMGEVYRARDKKLDREVALKVLPREMSGDPERIARFQREARTLATLQHPNVASVYGFEELPEARFLVMELIEGEELADRLSRGALSIEDTVEIARQITEGLEAAHEKGIVHRDLKPANIKIDRDGAVKILDFGLARAFTGDPAEEDLANSPTITAAMTQAGTILGTAAYMSPEQAKGKAVDKRADIWAFGAIIFEMLTGRRLFDAETISETLASVLLTNIDWDRLPAATPPSIKALMERCLQKDPKLRLRDVGEARIVLADPTASLALRVATTTPTPSRRRTWPWAVALVGTLAIGLVGGQMLGSSPAPEALPPLLFDIPDPDNQMIVGSMAVSPDGHSIVFARRDSLGSRNLFLRRLDEDGVRMLPGTRGATFPFWSPDSRHIGFFTAQALFRISLDGSAASQITTLPHAPLGGSWNRDDVILVGAHDGPIVQVPAGGGRPRPVTVVDREHEEAHCWPGFLPDGKHFAFLSDASTEEGHRLWIHSLDGDDKKILLKGLRSATVIDPRGAILWSENTQLFAHPFDFNRREFSGERILLQDEVSPFNQRHELPVSVSGNGLLASQRGSDESVIVRITLADDSREVLLPLDRYRNPRLSADGRHVAFELQYSGQERIIWAQDLERGTRTRISPQGAMSDSAVWSADGEYVYFGSAAEGTWNIYRKRVYGGGIPERVGHPEGASEVGALDISRDGKWLLATANPDTTGWDFWLVRIDDGSFEWKSWLTSDSIEEQARFSPDSRWIVYASDTSGQSEVYVSPVDGGAEVRQMLVSVNGGHDAVWSPNGDAVFYRDAVGTLTQVTVRTDGDQINLSPPERIVEINPPPVGFLRNAYDVYPDGESVLAFIDMGGQTPAIRIRTGW
jgi:serine/threonine protein kinase